MKLIKKAVNYTVLKAGSAYGKICRNKLRKKSEDIDKVSEKLLLDLVWRNRNTEYGKKYDFAGIKSVEDYQDKVPLSSYDDYREYINRIAENGEQGLLTSDKVVFFAKTSGSTGETKRIPVVKKATKPYTETVVAYINIIKTEMKKRGIHCGKGLITAEMESNPTESNIREGLISAYTLESGKAVIPIISCIPKEIFEYSDFMDMKYLKAFYALADRDLVFMAAVFMSNITDMMTYIFENKDILIADIARGRINKDIEMPEELRTRLNKHLEPDPKRAEELNSLLSDTDHKGIMKRIWKKLSVLIGIGTGEFECFANRLRELCGDTVTFYYETYSSSEALIANAADVESDDYLMLTDSGFFEFIPIDEEVERPLLRHQLEVGKLYEIVITNLSGLYRYRILDVIRVIGFQGKNPLLHFAYRKNQVINITGVKLTSEQISEAVRSFENKTGLHLSDYTLYPDTEQSPWRLELFLELQEKLTKQQRSEYADLFDIELSSMNPEHGRMLKIGETSQTVIYQVKPKTFAEYRELRVKQGASQNQVKTMRVIRDKELLKLFTDSIVSYD